VSAFYVTAATKKKLDKRAQRMPMVEDNDDHYDSVTVIYVNCACLQHRSMSQVSKMKVLCFWLVIGCFSVTFL
jgi:hypothetical protein